MHDTADVKKYYCFIWSHYQYIDLHFWADFKKDVSIQINFV